MLTKQQQELQDIMKGAIDAALAPIKAQNDDLKAQMDALKGTKATNNAGGLVDGARGPAVVIGNKHAAARRKAAVEADRHKGKGFGMVAILRAQAETKERGGDVMHHLKSFGYDDVAEVLAEHTKALGESAVSSGGALVPVQYAQEYIELLRARAIVRQAGPRAVPLDTGTLSIPRQTGGATASYGPENTAITASQQTTGNIVLTAKKLTALTPLSNDLIRDTSGMADAMVRDDLVKQMALAEDLKFIRGDGTNSAPTGLLFQMNSGNKFNATQAGATATLAEVNADLQKLIGKLEDNKVPLDFERCVFKLAPRTRRFLMQLTDSVGRYFFAEEMATGRLLGYRFLVSQQIPTNLGSGTNESEFYFTHMDEVLLGDNLALELTVMPNGTYDSGGGTIVSGLSNDQTVVRAISKHDIALRHDVASACIQACKWGG